MISNHLDKNNLHHAYLIEGTSEEVLPEILKFTKELGVENNGDFVQINLDTFKIDDARNLKSFAKEKGFSSGMNAKKIFIVSANNFLLEAQNSLLKMFEEPISDTHFFIITPDVNSLLPTFISRFYLISHKSDLWLEDAEKFIKMSLQKRLDYIKELLAKEDEDEEDPGAESTRSKALKFLNELESALHDMSKMPFDTKLFEHIFKVREFLRMPGSSPKTLMESVALVVPSFSN